MTTDQAGAATRTRSSRRAVCLAMRTTLDGYVCGPDGQLDWMFKTAGRDTLEHATSFLRGVDTILLGRGAYLEQSAYWPTQTSEMADLLNSHTKIVFSRSLTSVDWHNSRLAKADLAGEIAELKAEPGKNIFVTGGASLAQSLSRQGLIDEYHLSVHPVAIGAGRPLFTELTAPRDLTLVDATVFDAGAVQLIYRAQ